MIAIRFQKVLDICTDQAQSAFLLGHLIIDNLLLAYDLMNTLKQRRVGSHGNLALKLDE